MPLTQSHNILLHEASNRPIRYICQADCSSLWESLKMLLEGTLHTSCYLVHASLFTKRTKLFLLRLKICCISLYTTVVLSRHISLKYYQHLLIEVCNACQCSVPHLVLPLGCDLGLQDLRNAALAFRPPVGSCEHAVTCFSVKEAQHDCLHPSALLLPVLACSYGKTR